MAPKKTGDHWSFLEEIEAPTWVDLTLETEYNGPDATEEWFNVTHKFHQCSSHQLKSGFSHHFEGKVTSEFKLQGSFSPKLPSSVSRSRGKDYRQKKLTHDPERIFPKAHTLKDIGSKSPYQKRGSYQEIKMRVATMKPKGSSTSRTGLVHENVESYSSKAKFNSKSSVSEIGMSSTSTTSTGAMNSQSSITFESSLPQQQNVLDISSQAFSNSSGLLSIARRSLRKSCVTRQASRLEMKNDADQRRGCRSSSGVSSVSSSSIPGVDVNAASSVLAEVKDITPDSRNVTRMLQTDKNRLKSSNVSEMQIGFIQQGTSSSAIRGITASANSAGEEAAKLKVQKSTSRNAVHHLRIKGRNVLTSSREDKAITKISSSKCAVSNGKENVRGNRTFSESCTGKNIAIGGAKLARRETNQDLSQPCGRRLLADTKVKLKAQIEGKTTRGATLKMHAQ